MAPMNVPTQMQVMGILQEKAEGVTAVDVALALGSSHGLASHVLEQLYASSKVECKRLPEWPYRGESLYRLPQRN